MERRKKAWMATFAAILIGHAYGKPSESVSVDEPPMRVQRYIDTDMLLEAQCPLDTHHDPADDDLVITACTPDASECP